MNAYKISYVIIAQNYFYRPRRFGVHCRKIFKGATTICYRAYALFLTDIIVVMSKTNRPIW